MALAHVQPGRQPAGLRRRAAGLARLLSRRRKRRTQSSRSGAKRTKLVMAVSRSMDQHAAFDPSAQRLDTGRRGRARGRADHPGVLPPRRPRRRAEGRRLAGDRRRPPGRGAPAPAHRRGLSRRRHPGRGIRRAAGHERLPLDPRSDRRHQVVHPRRAALRHAGRRGVRRAERAGRDPHPGHWTSASTPPRGKGPGTSTAAGRRGRPGSPTVARWPKACSSPAKWPTSTQSSAAARPTTGCRPPPG